MARSRFICRTITIGGASSRSRVSTMLRVSLPRRYLVRFQPKKIPHVFTDVLIVGSGIAGLRAAMEIAPPLGTIVICKEQMAQSNSAWAQGGIAGALDPID